MSYAVGNLHWHHSHRVKLYGGIYMCTSCGGTGSRKLIKLNRKCKKPTQKGKANINAYKVGKAPAGYPGWPYKRVHLMENEILNNIQHKVNQTRREYAHQYENPTTIEGSDSCSNADGALEEEPSIAPNDNNREDIRVSSSVSDPD